MIINIFITLITFFNTTLNLPSSNQLQGAWQSDQGVIIFAGDYFSFSAFSPTEFKNTFGTLDGAFAEEYSDLTAMLELWDRKE